MYQIILFLFGIYPALSLTIPATDQQQNYYSTEPYTSEGQTQELTSTISITPLNCSDASGGGYIWPSDSSFVNRQVTNVYDAYPSDTVTITITGIKQDEQRGYAADAIINPNLSNSFLLRALANPSGNGRVYTIYFQALASIAGNCSGIVQVGVPVSLPLADNITDDGALYVSTGNNPSASGYGSYYD